LHNLTREVKGVKANQDIESLHRMRVASRRLSNILWAYRDFFDREKIKQIRDEVKTITRLLGRARDLDTQAFFLREIAAKLNGLDLLIKLVARNRLHAQEDVLTALRRISQGKLVRAINTLKFYSNADVYRIACKNIDRRRQELSRLSKAALGKRSHGKLHKMRIGAKHLRYTLENFSFLDKKRMDHFIEEARLIQQTLGDMHNYVVWRFEARLLAGKDPRVRQACRNFAALCSEHIEESYREFLKLYQRQRREKVWAKLKQFMDSSNRVACQGCSA